MLPRPKSFASKLLILFVVVVVAAQLTTWLIVATLHDRQAHALINDDLQRAAGIFARNVKERNDALAVGAAMGVRDYAFKTLFAGDEIDIPTLESALPNFKISAKADVVAALTLEGKPLACTSGRAAEASIYRELVRRADADPDSTATGFGYLGGDLYSLVIAPVRTPDIVAWLIIGFRIDRDYAKTLQELTGVDVTFFDHDGRVLAATPPVAVARDIASKILRRPETRMAVEVPTGTEKALIITRRLAAGENRFALLALQYSLDEKLKPARRLETILMWVTIGGVVLAAFLSRAFARRLAQPIVELVGHTRRIAAGDYATRIGHYRSDELGRLAEAFDQMSAGLEERDRVRDLLDKNVSPEVAAQLLRDGAALGGEVREVTILFADLRGFTTMSEKFEPRELLTLLNRYLDRMSGEIEQRGGVIDKFIGDAIMALFGAPIAQGDAADRAVAAAIAMETALTELNRELAAEGRPPLAIGVGINTARVIAGNIGSHRRLNYSVIGDGVNVAARLQSETRKVEHQTNIITSAGTLAALRQPAKFATRSLGPVLVKGRVEPISIFAVSSVA